MPRARGLPQKLHQIGAALLLSAHPVSSPITDKPQASTTVTVSNNLFIETERSSPQKYRPFDAPLLPQFPTVRPRFEKLHLDDLRDSQAPAHWGLGFPVPRAVASPAERAAGRALGKRNGLGKNSATSRSTNQPKALEITPLAKRKASRAQHFSTSCAPARCWTYQLAVGAFASSSAWKAIATLGVRSGFILYRRDRMACETPSGLNIF